MYILYGGAFTRAPLVQWVMDEGGIAYELRQVDVLAGENRSAAFLALNPSGLVPVLVTPEGEVLTEVAALMLYLADRHRLSDLVPAIAEPDRGRFLSAFFHVASDIQPDLKRYHYPHRYSGRREDDAVVQGMAREMILKRLEVLDGRLERDGPWLVGQRFTMADFYLCFWIAFLDRPAALDRCPAIARLYGMVCERPRAQATLEAVERQAAAYDAMQRHTPGGIIA